MQEAVSGVWMIAGYRVLAELGTSKRFQAFRVEMGPQDTGFGTLYLMHEALPQVDSFVETVNAIWAAWPFEIPVQRGFVLPEAQVWKNRPWLVIPDSLPVLSSAQQLSPGAAASLKAQLDWLQDFQALQTVPGEFGHGDVRPNRIAFLGGEAFLVAPGWVAACDLVLGRRLSHTRADDAYHLAKLLVQKLEPSSQGMSTVRGATAQLQTPAAPPARGAAAAPARAPAPLTRKGVGPAVPARPAGGEPPKRAEPAAAPGVRPRPGETLRRPASLAAAQKAAAPPARAVGAESRFTAYWSAAVGASRSSALVVFVHPAQAEGASPADPLEEVARRAERLLAAPSRAVPGAAAAGAALGLPGSSEIVLVPRVDGGVLEFSPREHRLTWAEPIQQAEFSVQARAGSAEGPVRGALHVFMGVVLVAELPLAFEVSSRSLPGQLRQETVPPFQRVFAGYSQADAALVELHERSSALLGANEYAREVRALGAREVWSDALKELIRQAQVVQLFWSRNSMRSPFVGAEWEYALALGTPICPVFWDSPFPADAAAGLPPPALARLEFLNLAGGVHAAELARVPRLTSSDDEIRSVVVSVSTPAPKRPSATNLLDELEASALSAPPVSSSEPPPAFPSEQPPPYREAERFPSAPPVSVSSQPPPLMRFEDSSPPPAAFENPFAAATPMAPPAPSPAAPPSSKAAWLWLVVLALLSAAAAAYFMLQR